MNYLVSQIVNFITEQDVISDESDVQDFCSKNRFLYSFWMEKWYAVQRSAFESNNNP